MIETTNSVNQANLMNQKHNVFLSISFNNFYVLDTFVEQFFNNHIIKFEIIKTNVFMYVFYYM